MGLETWCLGDVTHTWDGGHGSQGDEDGRVDVVTRSEGTDRGMNTSVGS